MRFSGPLDAARHVLRTEGLAGLYRGGGLTLARDAWGSAFYFGTYELVRRWFARSSGGGDGGGALGGGRGGGGPGGGSGKGEHDNHGGGGPPTAVAVLLAGALAGQAHWLASMPLDVIKTRRQNQLGAGEASALALAQQLYQAEGARGFYRGLLPALLRAAPANAAFWGGVEATTAAIAWYRAS